MTRKTESKNLSVEKIRMDPEIWKPGLQLMERLSISQTDLGKASGLPQSRISEIKSMVDGTRQPDDRVLSLSKCVAFYRGLIQLVGWSTVKREFLNALEKTKDSTVKLLLIALMLDNEERDEHLKHGLQLIYNKKRPK